MLLPVVHTRRSIALNCTLLTESSAVISNSEKTASRNVVRVEVQLSYRLLDYSPEDCCKRSNTPFRGSDLEGTIFVPATFIYIYFADERSRSRAALII